MILKIYSFVCQPFLSAIDKQQQVCAAAVELTSAIKSILTPTKVVGTLMRMELNLKFNQPPLTSPCRFTETAEWQEELQTPCSVVSLDHIWWLESSNTSVVSLSFCFYLFIYFLLKRINWPITSQGKKHLEDGWMELTRVETWTEAEGQLEWCCWWCQISAVCSWLCGY